MCMYTGSHSTTVMLVDSERYGGNVSIADFRVYIHEKDGPLVESHVLSIARASTEGLLNSSAKCLPLESSDAMDRFW